MNKIKNAQNIKSENFERVIEFTNFVLKYGYSSTDSPSHDVLILRALNLKITLYFNQTDIGTAENQAINIKDDDHEENWKRKFNIIEDLLTK
jgi:hypothetical protein